MIKQTSTRRTFLKNLTFGAATLPLAASQPAFGAPAGTSAGKQETHYIRLGVASYSLRKFSRTEAIRMIREIGTEYVNIKSFHLPLDSTPNEIRQGRREFEQAGLSIVGGGTISMRDDSDEAIRRCFEYAALAGMPLMVIAPVPEALPRIERFVKEYDIKVAIHNHGPEDPYFPAPQDALKRIRNMDSRVGVCIDLGHTARTGTNVVESLSAAGDRLLDIHMKDLRDLRDKGSQCIVGEGNIPVADVFDRLAQMKYSGYVNLEYEIDPTDPLQGMKQSFAYMRGVLDGLGIRVTA